MRTDQPRNCRLGFFQLSFHGGQPDQAELRADIVWIGRRGSLERGGRVAEVAQPHLRLADTGTQLRLCLRLAELRFGEFGDDLFRLAAVQQRLREQRSDLLRRGPVAAGAAQFLLRAGRVADGERSLAEQQARLGVVRLLLHRILQLDDRGLRVTPRLVVAGRPDEIGGRLVLASRRDEEH